LPVTLPEPAEVDAVEDVAVEDEPGRPQRAVLDVLEQLADVAGLAVVAAQVQVREDDGVEHETLRGPGVGNLPPIPTRNVCALDEGGMNLLGGARRPPARPEIPSPLTGRYPGGKGRVGIQRSADHPAGRGASALMSEQKATNITWH